MKIEYYHASRYGNGVKVAEEFKRQMEHKGCTVSIHRMRGSKPKQMPPADLYVFSSPGRMGKPTWDVQGFLKKANLPAGTRYAILTTEGAPRPDKRTGLMPTEDGIARWQRVRPIMNEILSKKNLTKVAEDRVYVTGMKGPLEDDWEKKVTNFAAQISVA